MLLYSTDSDISSEHDDQAMSRVPDDVTMQHSTAAMSTRVVPHRINPNRSSGTVSPVTPHEEDPSRTKIQLDDSSPESDIDVDVESQPPPVTVKKKKDTLTLELSPRESDSDSEKKSSKKQKSSTTPPSNRVTKSETKEINFGSNKPTVSSQLLTRFTLAKETSQEPVEAAPATKAVSPDIGRLPEPLPPLKLKPEAREAKVSLSSLSPLSSDISSPRSPPFGSKSMQLNVEKLALESPTQRSYKLDSLAVSPIATASTKYLFPPPPPLATASKDDSAPLLSPTITTNSEGEDSDNLSVPPATPEKQEEPVEPAATKSIKNMSPTISSRPVKELSKPTNVTVKESGLIVSIDRKYITLPQARGSSKSRKKKQKSTTKGSGPPKYLVVSIPKKHYFHALTSRQKSKLSQPITPATVAAVVSTKQEHKTKVGIVKGHLGTN